MDWVGISFVIVGAVVTTYLCARWQRRRNAVQKAFLGALGIAMGDSLSDVRCRFEAGHASLHAAFLGRRLCGQIECAEGGW